jgi:CubicO group peptidase (beta-lactamase class C family)
MSTVVTPSPPRQRVVSPAPGSGPRSRVRLAVLGAALLALVASTIGPVSASVPARPGEAAWVQVERDRVAAECQLDPDLLDEADARFPESSYMLVRFGKLCWSSGGTGPSMTDGYSVQSVTKTFGAILVGMVAARSSLNDTDYVSQWLNPVEMAPLHPDARVAHVLATTAVSPRLATDQKVPWTYDILGYREINKLRDIINKVIEREPENFPGVSDVFEFAQRELFDVLGMQDSSWTSGGFGFGLTSSTRDLARLGLLLMRKGDWNGVPLLEEEYVYRMTHPAFEDSNTGYGYLTWLNSQTMNGGGAGTNPDNHCAPYAVWPEHPHGPFWGTKHDYGASPFEEHPHDIGVAFAAGLGGQYIILHRGLDLIIAARDATGSDGIGAHQLLWDAVRPALLAHDPVYAGDEEGFCEAYRSSTYAPTMLSPWFDDGPSDDEGDTDHRNHGGRVSDEARNKPKR